MSFPYTFPITLESMVDKIRPLKLESLTTGGSMEDSFPTAANPAEDYASVKGVVLEDNDNIRFETDGANNIQFVDPVSGVVTIASLNAKVSADGSIDTHSDVDTTTTPPTMNQFLQWDGSNWAPGSASGAPVDSVNGQTGVVVLDTDDISEGATNLYYTDTRVSANSSVVANTAKVSADGSINTHSDVDTATTPPTTGESLIWDGANFVPGQSLNDTTHRALDQLVHDVAETSYSEITRASGVVTDVIIWTSVAKTTKIRETNITRTSGLVSQVVEKQYDGLGVLTETLTQAIARDGNNQIINITNTLS